MGSAADWKNFEPPIHSCRPRFRRNNSRTSAIRNAPFSSTKFRRTGAWRPAKQSGIPGSRSARMCHSYGWWTGTPSTLFSMSGAPAKPGAPEPGQPGPAVAAILRDEVDSLSRYELPRAVYNCAGMTVCISLDRRKLSAKADFSLISETIESSFNQQSSAADELRERIANKKARVGVLGLGYVGLPLAVEFAHAGFEVVGIDVQQSKVDQFNSGHSYVKDVKDEFSNLLSTAASCGRPPISPSSANWTPSISAFRRRCARPKIRI